MKIAKILLVLFILIQVTAFAAEPDLKMITSLAALRSYADEAVVAGDVWVSGQTIVASPTGERITTISADLPDSESGAQKMIYLLNNNAFKFGVTDKSKSFRYGGQLKNNKGNVLFVASKEVTPRIVNGGLSVGFMDAILQYDLSPSVPVSIPGIVNARVVITDQSGNPVADQYIEVQNGQMFWPTNFTERKGVLVTTIADPETGENRELTYDLSKGSRLAVPSVYFHNNGEVEGVVRYYRPTDFRNTLVRRDDLLILTIFGERQVTFGRFYGWHNFDEVPVAILIRKKGQPWTRYENNGEEFSLLLEAGVGPTAEASEYYIIIEWPANTDRPIDYWPYYGGKG